MNVIPYSVVIGNHCLVSPSQYLRGIVVPERRLHFLKDFILKVATVHVFDGYTIRPTKRGSAITVTGLEKTLLGASGSPTGVVSKYSDMLLFYVPQTGSDDRIRLLGVTQGLLSIRSR